MMILARLLGLVIVVIGAVVAANPAAFKAMVGFWMKGKNIYLAGALRLLFGILFLSIAQACRFSMIIYVLGILMIVGGILVFMLGPERIKTVFGWWEKQPPLVLRLMGLLALLTGALIIYSI